MAQTGSRAGKEAGSYFDLKAGYQLHGSQELSEVGLGESSRSVKTFPIRATMVQVERFRVAFT